MLKLSTPKNRVRLELEALEDRVVPAFSSVHLAGGVLQIQGTADSDQVHVFNRGHDIIVQMKDLSEPGSRTLVRHFNKARVKEVEFHGAAGDDVFQDDITSAKVRSVAFGDDGNDLLKGGVGENELHGGAGQNTLIGGPSDDLLVGGSGADDITGNGGHDRIENEGGDDTVHSSGGEQIDDPAGHDHVVDDGPHHGGNGGNSGHQGPN
jgi:Ca2+-binding RTX toxin-like protein